jgi:NADPH-dependent ferric siderophore reductase
MPCHLRIDEQVQDDILACDEDAARAIGNLLERLQKNPFPRRRIEFAPNAYYIRLDCGFFVSWEIIAPRSTPISLKNLDGLVVRILGIARASPVH